MMIQAQFEDPSQLILNNFLVGLVLCPFLGENLNEVSGRNFKFEYELCIDNSKPIERYLEGIVRRYINKAMSIQMNKTKKNTSIFCMIYFLYFPIDPFLQSNFKISINKFWILLELGHFEFVSFYWL